MKRKIVLIVLCILSLSFLLYLQFGQEPVVNNMITDSHPSGYTAMLSVTANKIVLINQDDFANKLIQKTIHNEFKNMQLSYDILGFPNQVTITVYTNALTKTLGIPAFQIKYSQEDFASFQSVNPSISTPPITCQTVMVSCKITTDTSTATRGSI